MYNFLGEKINAPFLPAEVLPSTKEENDRLLEAITISDSCMDPDVRAALFEPDFDFDDNALADDFVLQASAEPTGNFVEVICRSK